MERVAVTLREELTSAQGKIAELEEEAQRKDDQITILSRRVVKTETR